MPTLDLAATFRPLRYVPVIELDNADDAVPLAEALIAGGIGAIEVTLRTPAALDGIRKLSAANLPILVGAGTVVRAEHAAQCRDVGAKFAISPGYTEALDRACRAAHLPLLPGAVTASEVMLALDAGYTALKFFPANIYGGAAWLKAIRGPLPQASFVATGGITDADMADYWAQSNLLAVGSSSVAPAKLIREKAWAEITVAAKRVMAAAKAT
jgi:2-dehydro-3-deoxyphosphogluconate aldolase / (4S)-4-hydroxy-2-oxoglutarate aldolase